MSICKLENLLSKGINISTVELLDHLRVLTKNIEHVVLYALKIQRPSN